jgi:16S rRNA (cytidine1402-2'-O)-methyltransferase
MPIVGTVPAIKPAAAATKSGLVSVLATPGTVRRDYTIDLIRDFARGVDVTLVGSKALAGLAGITATLVFYETAPRLEKSLRAIAALWPAREVAVARELTKLHEECRSGTAENLADHYAAHPPKGEIVLLIGPPAGAEAPVLDADALLRAALADAGPGKAAGQVAKATGLDRADLYARALELKGE